MDVWDHQQQQQQQHHRHGRHRKQTPSFSSSLLDAIYRSIDDDDNGVEPEAGQLIFYTETMRKKQSSCSIDFKDPDEEDDDRLNFRRACMIEKWMEKKVSEKVVVVRRSSMADFDRKARNVRDREHRDFKKLTNSSSSSSESSSGGGFSSSESETRSSRPRPIRTTSEKLQFDGSNQKPKHENGFVKTKSKALKIYGDLKKVKQPISPGGRLATFLNSLFNGGGSPKKQKFTNSDAGTRKSKSAQGSTTCSSASSFSRSCLSKTPSSGEKLLNNNNNGSTKRSVRFCPVSVILDEESRPCGHKNLQDELGLMTAAATTLRNALRNDHSRAEEEASAEDPMTTKSSYQKKIINNGDVYINREDEDDEDEDEDEEDDDDDAASCSSSDLFELDNLSSIGVGRYREELPVYETTHFSTNQAIAKGLIL